MDELFWLDHQMMKEMTGDFKAYFNTDRQRIHGIRVMVTKDGQHFMSGTLSMSKFSASQFFYLLSKHFDLFGLIEQNLAIDKSTLK